MYSGIDIKTEGGVQGTSCEAGGSRCVPVKSFASYKKSKGKEWKSRVTKSSKDEKKKNQDVVVHVGLMAWNEKDQALKPKRGKRLPLRISPTAGYVTLRKQAEEKWKTYHSNLYDETQSYHLLLEDGHKALFLPGSNKESFTLGRYQEEVGKDFKRITLFLCPEFDFQISEGNFDENDLSDFENDGSGSPNKRRKWEIDLMCDIDCQTSSKDDCLDHDQELERNLQVEADHPPEQDQKPGHGPSERDLDLQCHQQLEQDQQFASDLQRIYDAEEIIVPEDDNSSMISDSYSVVTFLGKQVDQSSQLFVVMRRGAPLNRVLSIWSREVKKNSASVKQTVRVHFSGEQGIDSGALAKEFFTMTLPKIGSVIFPNGQPVDSTLNIQNGNFKACGEIVAASIAQGGPAPCFLEESVYGLMANPNVPLQELDMERHLTATDRELLNTTRDDITAHTDTIIEHGYTGSISASHIEEIISSVATV